jgi:ribosomal protein S18 acetylase RimI-like enzyme
MDTLIRKARFKDRVGMDQCNRRNLPENYDMNYWEQHLQIHPYFSYVIVHGTSIVGYALCDGQFLLSLAIDSEHRKKGWGTKLLQELQSQFSTLKLQVRKSNQTAQRLYNKMGFVVREEMAEYYNNPTENAYLMEWSGLQNGLPKPT